MLSEKILEMRSARDFPYPYQPSSSIRSFLLQSLEEAYDEENINLASQQILKVSQKLLTTLVGSSTPSPKKGAMQKMGKVFKKARFEFHSRSSMSPEISRASEPDQTPRDKEIEKLKKTIHNLEGELKQEREERIRLEERVKELTSKMSML